VEKVDFFETHIFKYSKRDGTRAASMPNQVDEHIKNKRSNELISMGEKHSKEFIRYYEGRTVEVLFEEKKADINEPGKSCYIGHTRDYIKVAVPASNEQDLSNEIRSVKIHDIIKGKILMGELTKSL
jgi:threonylcarbamoyladenosine tRNA methylthiotransferase MtaB